MTDKHTPGPWRTIGNETIMAIHRYESELIASGERMLDAEYGPERIAARQARLAELAAQTEKDRAMTHPLEEMLMQSVKDNNAVFMAGYEEGYLAGKREALAALKALMAYASHQGRRGAPMRSDPADMQGAITDLLTDLRHYCALNGEDFEKHMSRSAAHFNAEIAE